MITNSNWRRMLATWVDLLVRAGADVIRPHEPGRSGACIVFHVAGTQYALTLWRARPAGFVIERAHYLCAGQNEQGFIEEQMFRAANTVSAHVRSVKVTIEESSRVVFFGVEQALGRPSPDDLRFLVERLDSAVQLFAAEAGGGDDGDGGGGPADGWVASDAVQTSWWTRAPQSA